MPSYSPAFKEQAVRRLMPPNSQSIPTDSRELSVTISTLYGWMRQFESKGFAVPAKTSTPNKWNMKSKLVVIIQTASMNEAERAAYCREKHRFNVTHRHDGRPFQGKPAGADRDVAELCMVLTVSCPMRKLTGLVERL